jgi:hypothetical protein
VGLLECKVFTYHGWIDLVGWQVEHIFREENLLAAYDVLELFCELVTVRLPIIESQKYVVILLSL